MNHSLVFQLYELSYSTKLNEKTKNKKEKQHSGYDFIFKFLSYNNWHCDLIPIMFVLPLASKTSLNLTGLQSLFMFPLSVIGLNNTSSSSDLVCCVLVPQEKKCFFLREVFVCYADFYRPYMKDHVSNVWCCKSLVLKIYFIFFS